MTRQVINIGSAPNDSTGDPLRTAFSKCNGNFAELYGVGPPQGRLTLVTGTPVMTSTQTAKNTIYYTPYLGNRIPIMRSGNIEHATFTELSTTTTDTTKNPSAIGAGKVNDWFVWLDSSTVRLCHGPDWTSDTVRSAGAALARVEGVLTNAAAITNGPAIGAGTYVGTTRSGSDSLLHYDFGGTASGGTSARLYVWNAFNKVLVSAKIIDNGASYTYGSATIRGVRGQAVGAGMAVNWVQGLIEESVSVVYAQRIDIASAGGVSAIYIMYNSDTASIVARTFAYGRISSDLNSVNNHAVLDLASQVLGYQYIRGGENSDTGTNTFNAETNSTFMCSIRM